MEGFSPRRASMHRQGIRRRRNENCRAFTWLHRKERTTAPAIGLFARKNRASHPISPLPTFEEFDRKKDRNIPALLVEDNRADVLLVQEAIELHELPIELHVVGDGEQAFQFIERADADPQAPCPKLVLLDLNLPKRHGKEVLQRVRASRKCQNVPVLIISSSDLPKERDELAKLGANRYFRKPSGYEQFMKVGEVLKEILKEFNIS